MTTNPGSVNSRNSIFERNPKITILFVITIAVLILDVALTNTFSLYTAIKNDEPNTLTSQPILGVKHEVYHHDLIKSGMIEIKHSRLYDRKIKLHTNSLGFKDKSSRTISLLPSKKFKKRIVFIGDSFTEGVGLVYEDTFVGIVDKELNNKSIEVLNAGVSSYSPIIYWRKTKYLIEEVGLKFDELAVFVDISDFDDEKYQYRLSKRGHVIDLTDQGKLFLRAVDEYGGGYTELIKIFIKNQTTLLYHITNTLHDFINRDTTSNFLWDEVKKRTEMGGWYKALVYFGRRATWVFERNNPDHEYTNQKMIKYMDKLLRLTRDNNIKLTIAVYPWPFQVWYEDLNSVHVKTWEEWSRRNNVNFINYFPDFISKGLTNKKKLELMKKYYIPVDVHFNKQGNKVIAKKFLEKYFPTE
jgi:lysophospholipase L1-like esterase